MILYLHAKPSAWVASVEVGLSLYGRSHSKQCRGLHEGSFKGAKVPLKVPFYFFEGLQRGFLEGFRA